MKTPIYISGFGSYSPETIITNADLAKRVDTSDEWITTRTGIKERRMAAAGEMGSDLALAAARVTLERTGLLPSQLTHIFYATCTPDVVCPPSSCILASKLGIKNIAAFDVNAACSGFVYALQQAAYTALADENACILLVASELLTSRCNWQDRSTCILFGDGAGAAIVSAKPHAPSCQNFPTSSAVIQDVLLSSDGSLGELLNIGSSNYAFGETVGPEYFIRMQGRDVFKHAVRSMGNICQDLLQRNGLTPNDIDLLVPHQANMRIIEAVGSRLEFSSEKVFCNVHKYGNTSAASIPLALAEAVETNRIQPGMRVLLTTFGGGFTWGAALLHF